MGTGRVTGRGDSARAVLVVMLLALLPGSAAAQSSVAGLVTDETGGVLPGVTVEASSPALIGGVRTAVTDGQGRYAIVDLRPGTYAVTFSLSGFSRFVRDGIDVTASASVPINAQMSVGALEETVTVTGATPVVDVQQATRRQVLDRETLDALPTNRTTHSVGAIISGIKMSGAMVGGARSTVVQMYVRAPGKATRENVALVDGIDVALKTFGLGQQAYNNFGMTQEIAVETNPASADVSGGGVKLNVIPKEGGNTLTGDLYFSGMSGSWQADNITDELRNKGLRTPEGTDWMYDLNPGVGGPIARDKVWFYVSGRLNKAKLAPAGGAFFDPDPVTGDLVPGDRQGFNDTATDNISFRVTWQASQNNKLATYRDQWWRYQSHFGGRALQDWATVPRIYNRGEQYIWPTKWTNTASNRVLIEGAFQYYGFDHTIFFPQPGVLQDRPPLGLSPDQQTGPWYANASRQDLVLGTTTHGSGDNCCTRYQMPSYVVSGSVSYVTGSHTFKVGGQMFWGFQDVSWEENNASLQQRYRNGVPDSVNVGALPSLNGADVDRDLGFYAQDRWTIDRLTVNAGVRFEQHKSGIRSTSAAAGRFVPARSQGALDVFDFSDVLPRFSLIYDLFGDARTALKVSAGKYVLTMSANEILSNYSPLTNRGEARNWFDCDLTPGTSTCSGANPFGVNGDDIAQDNEIGPSNIANFGYRPVRRADPDNLNRESSWQYTVSIDQQVAPGVSVTAAWYHQREGNLWAGRDTFFGPGDFTPFQIANPMGGGEMISVYNLKPGTLTGDVVTFSSETDRRVYNGFEFSAQARLPNGATLMGGWFTDRKVSTLCDTNDPNLLRFCDQSGELHQDLGEVPGLPYRHEFKAALAYPLPWDLQLGLSFLSYPGGSTGNDGNAPWLDVNYPVPAGAFLPVGGRTRSVTVLLIPPGGKYLKRWNQLDLSFKRNFRVGGVEILPSLDFYNLNNSSVVLSELESFGGALGRPLSTLPGRFMRLGALVRF